MLMTIPTAFRRRLLAALLAAPMGVPLIAQAQQPPQGGSPSPGQETEAAGVESYWTTDRLRQATPPGLPTPSRLGPGGMPQGAQIEGPELQRRGGPREESKPGSPPTATPDPSLLERQLIPQSIEVPQPSEKGAGTEAGSSFGAFFTTARASPDTATTSYPYRVAGKLFFTDPRQNTNHVCSAAVLRPRLVATAGHCVTKPSTDPAQRYFYTNFLFVPAFNNGAAPYGTWTSRQQWVSNAWFHSDGSVPNPGDFAILIMNDRDIGGQTRKIGEVTGWLGYIINALSRNHVTMLGYPCNLDSCSRMIITNAGSFASGGNNTFIYGSAGRGGHSGGAWIQDFGVAPTSNPPVALAGNYLVGVTSYGPVATEPKYLGSSNLDGNFTGLLQSACGSQPGNCP